VWEEESIIKPGYKIPEKASITTTIYNKGKFLIPSCKMSNVKGKVEKDAKK
jgi:hypothetical protein